MNAQQWRNVVVGALAAGLILLACLAAIRNAVAADRVVIPSAAERLRPLLQIEARRQFGLDAPVSRLAAQIHQESHWRDTAQSPYAQGLAQFTPATAEWIAKAHPDLCAPANPWSTQWAITCMALYDKWLYDRMRFAATEDDRWAFTLSAYNGGPGWLTLSPGRDRALCRAALADTCPPCDDTRWWGNVEYHSRRSPAAKKENRGYPLRIMRVVEPVYRNAGW